MSLDKIKLKTLLIFPPLNPEIDFGSSYRGNQETPPLGIALLAGYLKKLGYRHADLINLRLGPELKLTDSKNVKKIIKKIILEKKPDVVGLSILFYAQLAWAKKIAAFIRSLNKNIFIVGGGGQITNDREATLINPAEFKAFNGLIFGNGEKPLAELLYRLANKKNLAGIPNLLLPGGKIVERKFFPLPEILDTEPDFSGLNLKTFIPIRLSKGCYWGKCAFCDAKSGLKAGYQILPVEQAVRLIKRLAKKYRLNNFYFYDDALPPGYLKILAQKLIEQKISITWTLFGLCLDKNLISNQLAALLKKSGLTDVCFGGESFSPRILKLMNKIHSPEIAARILKIFKDNGINAHINILQFFPSETPQDRILTFDFLKKYRKFFVSASVNIFYPKINTEVYRHPKKFSLNVLHYKSNILKTKNEKNRIITRLIRARKLEDQVYINQNTLPEE